MVLSRGGELTSSSHEDATTDKWRRASGDGQMATVRLSLFLLLLLLLTLLLLLFILLFLVTFFSASYSAS